jgi:ribosomal protein L9
MQSMHRKFQNRKRSNDQVKIKDHFYRIFLFEGTTRTNYKSTLLFTNLKKTQRMSKKKTTRIMEKRIVELELGSRSSMIFDCIINKK